MNLKRALITGASSGIGRATARRLAQNGMDLILMARRQDRLDQVKQELENQHKVKVLTIAGDIRDNDKITGMLKRIGAEVELVDVLINNAGLALGTAKMQDADPADWQEMMETNVLGLLNLTRWMLPHLLKKPQSHVVNIGSVAGRWVYPGGAVYCASKFAVRAISEGLRMDLAGTSVRVTNIEPGMVETEFSNVRLKDDAKAKAVYSGMSPLLADDVAECIEWSLTRPARVNIQELVVFPTDQATVGMVHRR